MWKITYIDKRTGLREWYMGIGFESEESAERERQRIIKMAKPWRNRALPESQYIRSWMIGKAWRLEKIKLRKL